MVTGADTGKAAEPVVSGELFAPDDEFVDSAELERKHFNMDDKKKFGQVADVTGQVRTVYFDNGEGVTTPLTFTRERRCSLIDDLRILGK